mgnify:CR=1 FL=1
MAFPAGVEDLKEYVLELKGAKDHWVKNINDPSDTRWEYTYHGRLAAYGSWKDRKSTRLNSSHTVISYAVFCLKKKKEKKKEKKKKQNKKKKKK